MKFEFATATSILFGAGEAKDVGAKVKNFGQRVLVVTGRDASRAQPILTSLQQHGKNPVTFSVAGEPDIAVVEQGTKLAKQENCDFVVAVGGGSVVDTGKAIAAMVTNEGELLDYLEVIGRGQSLKKVSAPLIAIPTTAGTGSEVTRNAVLASSEHKVKVSLRSPFMYPRLALVDPELTHDLPPALTASTGMDALTQVIEPYVCSRANPMTDGLCLEGIHRVAWALRVAFENGQDKLARESMAIASLHGGLALANAGLGAVHGFAGPIGGMFPAPHGTVCAALLPHVMTANLQAMRKREERNGAIGRYEVVARALTGIPNASADAGIEWVQQLVKDLAIPPLRTYGIAETHVAELVSKATNASSMKANPIVLTSDELADVLRAAL